MLRNFLAVLAILSSGLASPVHADAHEDARYIVGQTFTPEILEGVFAVLGPMMVSAVEAEMESNGITLSDPKRFMDILLEEFQAGYIERMHIELSRIYVEDFSPEHLAAIADFYASPAGQALTQGTPRLTRRASEVGRIAGELAAAEVGPRVAARLEAEGVEVTSDKSAMDRLLDMLR